MANFVSPGVYVIEKDVSDYPASINSSVVGIVGFAGRGPIAGLNGQKATLITSVQQLIDVFGEPSESLKGQAIEGAQEILETTASLRFIRAADATAAEASAAVQMGACPAVLVSGTAANPIRPGGAGDLGMSAIGSADLGTSDVRITATCYDQLRATTVNARTYNILKGTLSTSATNGATTMLGLSKILGGALDADRIGAYSDSSSIDGSAFIVNPLAGDATTMELSCGVKNDADVYVPGNIFQVLDEDGAAAAIAVETITASGFGIDTDTAIYMIKSLWAGGGYNTGTRTDGSTSGVSFEVDANGGETTLEQVNNLGVAAESFKAGFTSGAFLENSIGTTYDGKTSDYVTAAIAIDGWDDTVSVTALPNFVNRVKNLGALGTLAGTQGVGVAVTDINPRFAKLVQGTYNLADGSDGVPAGDTDTATAIIGSTRSDGGKTGIEALDDDVLNISIALTPGTGVGDNQSIQNALITMAERTTNFLALISPPFAIGRPGDAIDWTNGFATSRSVAVNSSYAAIYWPWLQVFSVADGKNRWLAPEIFAARQMGYTDNVADPWWAPAGFVRGRLTKPTDVEVILNQGDRDSMYSGGNCINPIVNFPQNGIAIFGQRTAQRQPTALDRINVRRLMIYIKKVILASTQRLVFEPNDAFTWARVEQLINPLMGEISNRRGITQYKVICDASVNTPIRVDRNEMWCKVLIKPTKTAEMVIFELNLTNQSAQF